jgi:hypothetical protein
VSKICDSISGGKEEIVESVNQHVLILNSQDGIVSIKGTNIPQVSIGIVFIFAFGNSSSLENCSFNVVKVLTEIACLDVSNCQFVRIECSKMIGGINIERSKGCVIELNNAIAYPEVNVAACLDLKIIHSTVDVWKLQFICLSFFSFSGTYL